MSSDVENFEVLTPGHFIVGHPLNLLPEPSYASLDFNRLDMYQQRQEIVQQLWKHFSSDYFHELQRRDKWRNSTGNLSIGHLVLIHDESPPTKWKMGRIVHLHLGKEGHVRVATIKTSSGT